MKQVVEFLVRVALFAFICFMFWLAAEARLSNAVNLSVIVLGVLVTFPVIWIGRKGRALPATSFARSGPRPAFAAKTQLGSAPGETRPARPAADSQGRYAG